MDFVSKGLIRGSWRSPLPPTATTSLPPRGVLQTRLTRRTATGPPPLPESSRPKTWMQEAVQLGFGQPASCTGRQTTMTTLAPQGGSGDPLLQSSQRGTEQPERRPRQDPVVEASSGRQCGESTTEDHRVASRHAAADRDGSADQRHDHAEKGRESGHQTHRCNQAGISAV